MKTDIDFLIKKISEISLEEFFKIWNNSQDIFLIKYDGLRKEKKYTIILLGADSRFEAIRYDVDDVKEGIIKTLIEYKKYL